MSDFNKALRVMAREQLCEMIKEHAEMTPNEQKRQVMDVMQEDLFWQVF